MIANRVLETSVTGGTGDLVLDGAVLGYQSFVAAIGDGNDTYYTIWDEATGDWEIGIGRVAGGSTPLLIREDVLDSSASGVARVAFQAQQKYVFVDLPASERIFRDTDGTARMQRRTAGQTEPLLVLEDETGAVVGGIDAAGYRFGTLTNLITEELTIGVVRTGGSPDADPLRGELFDDLLNALAWCGRYRFAARVRIDVGAGEWSYAEAIILGHPDGHQIDVVGAAPAVALSTAVTAPAASFEPDRNNPTAIPGRGTCTTAPASSPPTPMRRRAGRRGRAMPSATAATCARCCRRCSPSPAPTPAASGSLRNGAGSPTSISRARAAPARAWWSIPAPASPSRRT